MSAAKPPRRKTIRPTFFLPQLRKLSMRGRLAMAVPALAVVVAGTAVAAYAVVPGNAQLAADVVAPSTTQHNANVVAPGNAQLAANAVNPNCTLVVPANPLTAKGLATPYQLTAGDRKGGCSETNVNQSAFVQATIVDPATGKLSVYDPLVVTKGSQPAAAPVVPTLPAGAVVGICSASTEPT